MTSIFAAHHLKFYTIYPCRLIFLGIGARKTEITMSIMKSETTTPAEWSEVQEIRQELNVVLSIYESGVITQGQLCKIQKAIVKGSSLSIDALRRFISSMLMPQVAQEIAHGSTRIDIAMIDISKKVTGNNLENVLHRYAKDM